MMPASVQVCPFEIPGRGRRSNEAPITDVAQFADVLAAALPLQVPCFSHSIYISSMSLSHHDCIKGCAQLDWGPVNESKA